MRKETIIALMVLAVGCYLVSMIKRAISPLNASAAEYAKMWQRAGRKQLAGQHKPFRPVS